MRLASWFSLGGTLLASGLGGHRPPTAAERVVFNDNRIAAGRLVAGTLSVALVAEPGDWHPYPDSAGVRISVFGEAGKAPVDPGPLLRVPQGTVMNVTIHNTTATPIVVHGLSRRKVPVMDTLVVPVGETRTAHFTADAPGTFYYWASAHGEGFEQRYLDDTHLNGAFVVDAPGSHAPDRIFVMEVWAPDTTGDGFPDYYHELWAINGRPWPYSERLSYDVGDSVRWRIINAATDSHPFHMHGFFYRVNARGDDNRDTTYWPGQQRTVVTEPMMDGTTMDMAWRPDRPGNWIFHCHFNLHVPPNTMLPPDTEPHVVRRGHLLNGYPDQHMTNHAWYGMGGLVLGINVRVPAGYHEYAGPRRTLRLLVQSDSGPGDKTRKFGYVVQDGDHVPAADSINVPGMPIVLHRGEPTRIWVVNRTPEMTQVHWHGLEIESPYDGVAGLSGMTKSMAPPIMPGDSFEMHVIPRLAGTYIYHTHINDVRQQSHGLYGPLIVLDSGARWNPDTDRVFIVGDTPQITPIVNGGHIPAPLKAGVTYRFRLINISVFDRKIQFSLLSGDRGMEWQPLAKDAQPIPSWQRGTADAQQAVNIGETYDFAVQPPDTGTVTLEVRLLGRVITRLPMRVVH